MKRWSVVIVVVFIFAVCMSFLLGVYVGQKHPEEPIGFIGIHGATQSEPIRVKDILYGHWKDTVYYYYYSTKDGGTIARKGEVPVMLDEVIELILDHLNLELEYVPETKAHTKLVKRHE